MPGSSRRKFRPTPVLTGTLPGTLTGRLIGTLIDAARFSTRAFSARAGRKVWCAGCSHTAHGVLPLATRSSNMRFSLKVSMQAQKPGLR